MKIKAVSFLTCMMLSLTISSASFAVPQASPAPATAAQSAQTGDQLGAIRAACAEDAQKLCGTVQPGGGRIVACLKDHKESLSDRCRQAAGLPPKPNSSSNTGPAKSAPVSKAASKPVIVAGERFVERTLVDAQQGGIKAVTVRLPESWHFEGKIEWHYGWIEVPVNPSWHAENPANDEAYFQYESLRLSNVDVAPQYRQYASRRTFQPVRSRLSKRLLPWALTTKDSFA